MGAGTCIATTGSISMNLSEFLHMGGYAFYVWTSYGLTAVIMFLNYWLPTRREQQLIRKLKRLQDSKSG